MILVKGRLINEDQLLHVYDDDKDSYKPSGCTIIYINGKEFSPRDFKSVDIYNAIESKYDLLLQQAAEIEALKQELKDTEDLLIRANNDNEKLRLQIGTINHPKIKTQPSVCPGYKFDEDGLCYGNPEYGTFCTTCKNYNQFCEPAIDDENGCQGRSMLPDGQLYPRCQQCPGLVKKETEEN